MMLDKYLVSYKENVKTVIEKMEKETIKAVLVVDEDRHLMGLFSNGDMRSFFLKGGSLSANICDAMNHKPITYASMEEVEREKKMIVRVIYPIVDEENHVIDVVDDFRANEMNQVSNALKDIPLIIMAGGKGTRLYPYTKILPKPLIPIGDITITERIIQAFQKYGCNRVIMILNHKANMIKAYMTEIEKNYEIDFAEEETYLGTAGGLHLIKDKVNSTFFLSNCDVLINADLECVYKTHKARENKITFVCCMKDIVIPYGVIETDGDGFIKNMKEKPGFSFLINTGIYMIEPEVLDYIQQNEFIHLPDLARRLMEQGERVGVFPISEKSWLDMGQFSEMENMMQTLGIN